ncbi:MAG TPA: acetyl-CoA carboxylase biotin carboxyl carrier protein [Candidatus Gastranaerophilaceae bacterium]|nr:acetyl-CoA carboxylase biotin carboxyl carrier protein [Candidatus Gastranaerophilaceae bacterium]HPT41459.1 acetyl-CoA carboxylase biotin carboxyl carrier protein [Candidatus Gastranaerophilaceae bacterium]
MNFDMDYVKKLIKILEESSLTEIALEDGEKAIMLKKEKEVIAAPQVVTATMTSSTAGLSESSVCVAAPKGKAITSPMVGTFYKAPSPGAQPFVEVGATISEGQVVCIIEAMKLMNEIESEHAGKIVEICVEDGQAVEFGQVLMYVE